MPYCTLEDIYGSMEESDVIGYTDDAGLNTVDETRTTQAIDGAGSLIDAYLAKRYTVPLDPVPGMIRELAVDIAIYKICSRRDQAPDGRRKKYEDAIRFLERIAEGKALVPGASGASGKESDNSCFLTSDPRIFSRGSLGGF